MDYNQIALVYILLVPFMFYSLVGNYTGYINEKDCSY